MLRSDRTRFGTDYGPAERVALCPNSVNCEIARCIALALEGHIDTAKPILVTLRQRLQAMRDTEDRANYSVILTLVVGVAISLCWALKAYLPNGTMLFPQVALVLFFGALGGYFSVLTKINRLGLDPEASRAIMAVSAITRILVAMVGAFAVYTFLMSTFGKSLVNSTMLADKEFATVAIFAFLAGFSENFVPGIFNALDQRSTRQSADASAMQQTSSDLPPPAQRLARKL